MLTLKTYSAGSRRAVVSYWQKYIHEVLVNRLAGLSLLRKRVVRLIDRSDMILAVYRGRKTTKSLPNFFLHFLWAVYNCNIGVKRFERQISNNLKHNLYQFVFFLTSNGIIIKTTFFATGFHNQSSMCRRNRNRH